MADQLLFHLCDGWALGYDKLQWILATVDKMPPGAEKTLAGPRLRAVSFIGSTKAVLLRCIDENDIEPTPEAKAALDALPPTFKEWRRLEVGRGA